MLPLAYPNRHANLLSLVVGINNKNTVSIRAYHQGVPWNSQHFARVCGRNRHAQCLPNRKAASFQVQAQFELMGMLITNRNYRANLTESCQFPSSQIE